MRLLWRVISHGVVLVGVSAVAFLGISFFMLSPAIDQSRTRLDAWMAAEACSRVEHGPESARDVAALPFPVTVFSEAGRMLGTSSRASVAPLAQNEFHLLQNGRTLRLPTGSAVLCAAAPSLYAVVEGPSPPLPTMRVFFLVIAIAVLVSVGSVPLARSLVRPLRDLAIVAEKFGSGDLKTRASVDRSDEIGDLARAFNAMAANLNTHLLAQKELLANVSHELRTPLARIRVVLETAREDPARANTWLKEIGRDLGDLERLTDDVLTAIKLDFSGDRFEPNVILRPEKVSIVALLQQTVARCVEVNPDREIALHVADALPSLEGDPLLLLRLFDNVLENARKYSQKAIDIRANRAGDALLVEIEDHGIGIEEMDLGRIFDPFFRSDRSRRRTSGGTGLGLTLCRRIVAVHGGEISAKSEPGVGTTVAIRLPLATACHEASRSSTL